MLPPKIDDLQLTFPFVNSYWADLFLNQLSESENTGSSAFFISQHILRRKCMSGRNFIFIPTYKGDGKEKLKDP